MKKEIDWLFKEKYKGKKTEDFFSDLDKLKSGEPLAYIIGFVPFLNTTIFLDSHPLIPRTETEFWVEKILKKIKGPNLHILDLCAGSGCIGVAVLKNLPKSLVDFTEIDTRHHKTILKNIRKNNIDASKAKIIDGNLFENVTNTYDYILSNPPYINPKLDRTQQSVKKHEPALALYGEREGLEYIEEIIKNAKQYLKPTGELFIEHEPEQKKQIHKFATLHDMKVESFPDQFGIIRYTHFSQNAEKK